MIVLDLPHDSIKRDFVFKKFPRINFYFNFFLEVTAPIDTVDLGEIKKLILESEGIFL